MEIAQSFVDHEREKEFEVSVREIVLSICSEYACEIFVFGSRARGDIKEARISTWVFAVFPQPPFPMCGEG
jgi:hypothetical protein